MSCLVGWSVKNKIRRLCLNRRIAYKLTNDLPAAFRSFFVYNKSFARAETVYVSVTQKQLNKETERQYLTNIWLQHNSWDMELSQQYYWHVVVVLRTFNSIWNIRRLQYKRTISSKSQILSLELFQYITSKVLLILDTVLAFVAWDFPLSPFLLGQNDLRLS